MWKTSRTRVVTSQWSREIKASVSLAGSCSKASVWALESQVACHSRLLSSLCPNKIWRRSLRLAGNSGSWVPVMGRAGTAPLQLPRVPFWHHFRFNFYTKIPSSIPGGNGKLIFAILVFWAVLGETEGLSAERVVDSWRPLWTVSWQWLMLLLLLHTK